MQSSLGMLLVVGVGVGVAVELLKRMMSLGERELALIEIV